MDVCKCQMEHFCIVLMRMFPPFVPFPGCSSPNGPTQIGPTDSKDIGSLTSSMASTQLKEGKNGHTDKEKRGTEGTRGQNQEKAQPSELIKIPIGDEKIRDKLRFEVVTAKVIETAGKKHVVSQDIKQ